MTSTVCPLHARLERRLESLEERPDPERLLPELAQYRRVSEEALEEAKGAHRISQQMFDALTGVHDQVVHLAARVEALDDRIKDQRASLHEIESETMREAREIRGDRRKYRYQILAIIVGALVTAGGGLAAGRATAHAQCSHQAAIGR